jgi:hypothetical protein
LVALNSIGTISGWAVGWADAPALADTAGKTSMNPSRKLTPQLFFLLADTEATSSDRTRIRRLLSVSYMLLKSQTHESPYSHEAQPFQNMHWVLAKGFSVAGAKDTGWYDAAPENTGQ